MPCRPSYNLCTLVWCRRLAFCSLTKFFSPGCRASTQLPSKMPQKSQCFLNRPNSLALGGGGHQATVLSEKGGTFVNRATCPRGEFPVFRKQIPKRKKERDPGLSRAFGQRCSSSSPKSDPRSFHHHTSRRKYYTQENCRTLERCGQGGGGGLLRTPFRTCASRVSLSQSAALLRLCQRERESKRRGRGCRKLAGPEAQSVSWGRPNSTPCATRLRFPSGALTGTRQPRIT